MTTHALFLFPSRMCARTHIAHPARFQKETTVKTESATYATVMSSTRHSNATVEKSG
jgi:hypothetical protein